MLSQAKHTEAMDKLHLGFQCTVSSKYFRREIWEMGSSGGQLRHFPETMSYWNMILSHAKHEDASDNLSVGLSVFPIFQDIDLRNGQHWRAVEASMLLIKPAQMYFTLETAFLSLISILARTIQPVWQHCGCLELFKIALFGERIVKNLQCLRKIFHEHQIESC